MNDTPKNLVSKFFDETAKTYDSLVKWTTFNKDDYWKKIIINQMDNPQSILDLACGTGILTRKIAEKFPKAKITGVDITKSYLEKARKNLESFRNISYILEDAENVNLGEKFDCICSSYIPKYCNPDVLVKKCILHINARGVIIFHDFTYPKDGFTQKIWNMYFILLNFVGIFIPKWRKAFSELPKLIRSSNWTMGYQKALEQNGFDVKTINLTLNTSTVLVARLKKSELK